MTFPLHSFRAVALSVLACLALSVAQAQTVDDEHEAALDRAAVPDTTPQQRYQSAIREAGGALKVSLKECRASADRTACEATARQRYQADMTRARAMRTDPSIGPVNETGGPIRATVTETITIQRP